MSDDLDKLINEDVDIKNEMHLVFKQVEDGYTEIIKVYEKFEKPLLKMSGNLKEFARISSEKQEDSPFFGLAKKYESLIDGQKQLIRSVQENVIKFMDEIINKSALLNDTIKELNLRVKDARKLKVRIEKIDEEIEKLNIKAQPDKLSKKETEKKAKEDEYNLARDKLSQSKERFEKVSNEFNLERDGLLKNALLKLTDAEKAYIEVMKDIIATEEEVATNL